MSKPHIRYNTGPIRARQSPSLLGETVFTSLAEALDDRPGEHPLTYLSTPLPTSSSEAITIETENPTVNVVDLTTPNSFPLRHSTPDSSRRLESDLVGKKKSLTIIILTSIFKKRQFKPSGRQSEYDPSRLPT